MFFIVCVLVGLMLVYCFPKRAHKYGYKYVHGEVDGGDGKNCVTGGYFIDLIIHLLAILINISVTVLIWQVRDYITSCIKHYLINW